MLVAKVEAGIANGRRGAFAELVVDIRDDHLGSLPHKAMRGRPAESHQLAGQDRGRTRDQGHLVLQSHLGVPPAPKDMA